MADDPNITRETRAYSYTYSDKQRKWTPNINSLEAINGVPSTGNNRTGVLLSGQSWTGSTEKNAYADVLVQASTDQNGILYCDFSNDGTNWDTSLSFVYDTGRINPPHVLVKADRYYRTRFVNSGGDQTYARIYTYFGNFNKLTAPINGLLAENYDALVVRPTNYAHEVAMGKRQGHTTWQKWGYNTGVQSSAPEVVAHFGGTFNILTSGEALSVWSTSAADHITGTGARSITLYGVDENNVAQTETINLSGSGVITTSKQWLGVSRGAVASNGGAQVNVGTIYVSGSAGVQADIPDGDGITQQAIYHVQDNHKLLTEWLWVNVRKLSGGTAPRVTVRGWQYNRTNDTKYEIFRFDIDTAIENTAQLNPSNPFTIDENSVLYFTAETNTDNTTVNVRFSAIEERII